MSKRTIGSIQVALAALSWSFAGVLCKWLPWDALAMNGIRASIAVLVLALLRGGWRVKLTKGNVLGAIGVASTSLLFMISTRLTSAANAIVLQYAMSVFVIGFCWLFYHQRPSKMDAITAVFVLGGVVLCSWKGLSGGGNLLGDLLALLSAVTFSLVFFCSRIKGADAKDYSFLGLCLNVPFAFLALWDDNMSLEPLHWLAVLGMGLCLAGGYYFIARGMANTAPITAAILANLEPILNPLWVFIFLHEQPGTLTIIGAAIVLISATTYSILGNRTSHKH